MSEPSALPPETASAANACAENPPPEEREECPTPLQWHEIVEQFVQEAPYWVFTFEGEEVPGRTWGSGPPIYFLNGLSGSHLLYALTAYLLKDSFRCVLFDYPASRDQSVGHLAKIVPAIAREHGDDKLTLYGAGFGSLVAWKTATDSPQIVERIIAQSAQSHSELSRTEKLFGTLGKFTPSRFARVPGRWIIQQRSHRVWFPPYDESRFQFYFENSGESSTKQIARRFLASGQFDARPLLSAINQQTLLIRTEGEGPVQIRAAEELEAKLPSVQTEWMHTSGLLPFLTHPHRLAKLITQFLQPE